MRRTPLRARKRPEPINRDRRGKLSLKQYGEDSFILWLHGLVCGIPGCEARDVEQAHAKSRGAGGTWRDSLPLCRAHHREQHQLGLLTFETKYGVDLRSLAAATVALWEAQHE